MESQQDPGLTSYLKSMFVQFNGEQHSPPPVPAERSPKSSLTSEDPLPTDLNNNQSHPGSSPPSASPAPPPPPPAAGLPNGSIKVDVIVHNDATNDSVANSELNGHKEDIERQEDSLATAHNSSSAEAHSQPTADGNKIALSFLDELKHTLQVNKPLAADEAPVEPGHEQLKSGSEEPHKEPLGQQNNGANEEEEATREQESELPAASPSPPAPLTNSDAGSVQDDEGSANEEVSVESGINIEDDLDDQSSIASETTTVQYQPAETLSPNRQTLSRSASSDLNGSASTTRRVVLRSVSQDVKFKLESIREEKKVTKSHVSELANFWKGKMISPKEKN